MRIERGVSASWSSGGRLKTRCLVEKPVEYCGKGTDISVIQGVKSIRTRKTLVSENMKEKRNKRKVSGSYLRKKRFGIFLPDLHLTDK